MPALRPMLHELRASLKLAVPLVLAELGWMFMGIVDTAMVGGLPNSAEAIGAAGLGSVLFFTIAMFGGGILLSLDALVSQAFGAGRLDHCRTVLLHGVYMAALLTPPLMAISFFSVELLPYFGIHPAVLAQLVPFQQALTWSMLPLLLYFAFRRYLQSMNLVAPIMIALLTANLVNVLFNWLLIYGNLGFPALGIIGSAWATVLARVYMFASLAAYAWWHYRTHHGRSAPPPLRPSTQLLGQIWKLGLPIGLQITSEITIFALAAVLIGKLSPQALAAHEIAMLAASTTFMVPLGVSSAAAVRVGQAIGRRDREAMARAGWAGLLLGVGFMTLAALLFIVQGRLIARAFTADSVVIELTATLLVIAGLFQVADGTQIVSSGVLRGTGQTGLPAIATTIGYWGAGLPLGYYLAFKRNLGAVGIWIGFVLALVVVAVLLLSLWVRRSRALPAVQ